MTISPSNVDIGDLLTIRSIASRGTEIIGSWRRYGGRSRMIVKGILRRGSMRMRKMVRISDEYF